MPAKSLFLALAVAFSAAACGGPLDVEMGDAVRLQVTAREVYYCVGAAVDSRLCEGRTDTVNLGFRWHLEGRMAVTRVLMPPVSNASAAAVTSLLKE